MVVSISCELLYDVSCDDIMEDEWIEKWVEGREGDSVVWNSVLLSELSSDDESEVIKSVF